MRGFAIEKCTYSTFDRWCRVRKWGVLASEVSHLLFCTSQKLVLATRPTHTPWQSGRIRKENEGSAPRPLAVRVCRDCYSSLQMVTGASASAVTNRGTGGGTGGAPSGGRNGDRNGGGGDNKDGDGGNDESLPPRSIGDDGGYGRDAAGAAAEVEPEVGLDVDGSVSGSGGVSTAGDIGVGSGLFFVESLERVYSTEEIAGDVVLGDVLEWGRIHVSESFISPEAYVRGLLVGVLFARGCVCLAGGFDDLE